MNKYVWIPRGHEVKTVNDNVMEAAIDAIGNHYLPHAFGKAGNRGRRYISKKLGCSRREIKLLYNPLASDKADTLGNNYSHFNKVSRDNAESILKEIVSLCKNIPGDVIITSARNNNVDINKPQIIMLFEETLTCMRKALHDRERLNRFNKSEGAYEEVETLYRDINKRATEEL